MEGLVLEEGCTPLDFTAINLMYVDLSLVHCAWVQGFILGVVLLVNGFVVAFRITPSSDFLYRLLLLMTDLALQLAV